MVDFETLKWAVGVITPMVGAVAAGGFALVRRVNNTLSLHDRRLRVLEVKQEERDRALATRLDSIDDNISSLTEFLLNNPRRN